MKLFRRIRQNFLMQNPTAGQTSKTGKYLQYAIGEILLITIGLLLALNINNWNENRKDAIEEKIVLRSLLENLNLAKKQSELLISEEDTLKKRR